MKLTTVTHYQIHMTLSDDIFKIMGSKVKVTDDNCQKNAIFRWRLTDRRFTVDDYLVQVCILAIYRLKYMAGGH